MTAHRLFLIGVVLSALFAVPAALAAPAAVVTGQDAGGRGDVIVGLDRGCCTGIRVLQGASGVDRAGFYTYGSNSDVGVRVAAADVNGDGKAEILGTSLANTGVVDFYAPTGGMPFRSI